MILDRTLAALAEPHRRAVVDLLAERPRSAGELAERAGLAAPAMSRHLRALREARVVEETPSPADSRVRIYRLRAQPMLHLSEWLEEKERLFTAQASHSVKTGG
ncbi:MAG: ArsR/SmtB family transcription factor [Caulobacteraceae bacterium]